jgi:hypothetical protein
MRGEASRGFFPTSSSSSALAVLSLPFSAPTHAEHFRRRNFEQRLAIGREGLRQARRRRRAAVRRHGGPDLDTVAFLASISSSAIDAMALPCGSWQGSIIKAEDVERLRRTLRIPVGVVTRIPGEEMVPEREPGERVVFVSHFERGFGLPASAFFRAFLDFFGLQPHHLSANAFVTLSCYVAYCEAYAGLWRT